MGATIEYHACATESNKTFGLRPATAASKATDNSPNVVKATQFKSENRSPRTWTMIRLSMSTSTRLEVHAALLKLGFKTSRAAG